MPMSHVRGRQVLYGTLSTAYLTSSPRATCRHYSGPRPGAATELCFVPRIWDMVFAGQARSTAAVDGADRRWKRSEGRAAGGGRFVISADRFRADLR